MLLIALTISVAGFTGGVFMLVGRVFANFGPGIQSDLEWKTLRGAKGLAGITALGLAVGDRDLVYEGFGDYRDAHDVLAVVAVTAKDEPLAIHGRVPESIPLLLAGPPGVVRAGVGYLVSWSPSIIEGSVVGKVAVVFSTRRVSESQALLRRISILTGAAGLLALLGGILFVNVFTRGIMRRDAQLAAYASGLQALVVERTAELDGANRGMQLVLDNVEQGLVIVSLDGVMAPQRSTIVDCWLGTTGRSSSLEEAIRPFDAKAAAWIVMGLQAITDDVLPLELLIDQLPQRMSLGEKTIRLAYRPILSRGIVQQVLIVMSDMTDELVRERLECDGRTMMEMFRRISTDRSGFRQFLAEASDLMKLIQLGRGGPEEPRLLHTMKGNSALFGIESIARMCHEIESSTMEEGREVSQDDRSRLAKEWERVVVAAEVVLGERSQVIEIEESDYRSLLDRMSAGEPASSLLPLVQAWRCEPVSLRFARLAERARDRADRMGKAGLIVSTEGSGLRLDAGRWAPFWSAFVHAINNAVDHGIEDGPTRREHQKADNGRIWLTAQRSGSDLSIQIRDNGRGIDWPRLAERAAAQGLPHGTERELTEALFADGVSTKAQASDTSGRGVGLAALRQAARGLGGEVTVQSIPGFETTFTFCFPGA